MTKAIKVSGCDVSAAAKVKIEAAKGTVEPMTVKKSN
jgi:hypothetical protein